MPLLCVLSEATAKAVAASSTSALFNSSDVGTVLVYARRKAAANWPTYCQQTQ